MQSVPPPDGVVKRYTRVEDVTPAPGAIASVAAGAPIVLPSWMRDKVGDQPRRESLLRPSDADDDDDGRGQRTGESERLRQLALQRGNLVHRLLQSLPDIAAEKRRETALNFLARNANDWTDLDRVALATQVLSLIGDPRLAELFAPGSRAEVAVAGRLTRKDGSPVLVSGQIDRLVLTKTEIRIVDYKTNHNPPRKLIEAPKAYIRQLALYRGVLAKLYPDRPIRAALLWTETLEMMEISGAALDAELAAIISA
jgi:ATP-dependent helicase/nuclease subunit A